MNDEQREAMRATNALIFGLLPNPSKYRTPRIHALVVELEVVAARMDEINKELEAIAYPEEGEE